MKKQTKLFLLVGFLVGLTAFVGTAYAQSDEGKSFKFPFVNQLAEKLDMDEEELAVLVEEVREEHRTQMQETRTETINQAFDEGKLTERQMEILMAREEFRGTGGEKGSMLENLNEKGLDVTHEEMQEIRDLMIELGVGGNGKGHRRGL